MAEDGIEKPRRFKYVNLAIEIADDVIFGIVALVIVGLAVVLLIDAISEFAREAQHNYPYVSSELMFVLIIMEPFRRVLGGSGKPRLGVQRARKAPIVAR